MYKLPIPVPPLKHESLFGYLVRLAKRHSRKTHGELLRDCGWNRGLPRDANNRELRKFVAGITRLQSGDIADACRSEHYGGLFTSPDRVYKNLELKAPRVCLDCIAENPVHRTDWQFAPIAYCAEHQSQLTQGCPACGEPFKWNTRLLGDRCPQCFKARSSMSDSLKVDEPEYFSSYSALPSLQDRLDWVHDILLAVQRILRPMDILFDTWERPPIENENWHELIGEAYSLLTDGAHYTKWANDCATWRGAWSAIGNFAHLGPLLSLQSTLKQHWPIKEFDASTVKIQDQGPSKRVFSSGSKSRLVSLPSRIKCASSDNIDRTLSAQVGMYELSRALGCDSSDLRRMVELSPLQPLNNARSMRDALFCLDDVTQLLVTRAKKGGNTYLPLKQINHLLPLHATEPAELYAAIFSRKIRFVIDDGKAAALRRVRVSPFGLMRFLRQNLESKREEPMTLPAAARVLGLPESEICKLIDAGLLEPLPWQHKTPAFDGEQVLLILQQFAISSRWCRKRSIRYLTVCRRVAKSADSPPIVGNYLFAKESGIYNKLKT